MRTASRLLQDTWLVSKQCGQSRDRARPARLASQHSSGPSQFRKWLTMARCRPAPPYRAAELESVGAAGLEDYCKFRAPSGPYQSLPGRENRALFAIPRKCARHRGCERSLIPIDETSLSQCSEKRKELLSAMLFRAGSPVLLQHPPSALAVYRDFAETPSGGASAGGREAGRKGSINWLAMDPGSGSSMP